MRQSRIALEELLLAAKVYLVLAFALANIVGAAVTVIKAIR